MLVCAKCQRLGKPYVEETPPRLSSRPMSKVTSRGSVFTPNPRRITPALPKEIDELDLVDDYSSRVRDRRMKLELSQEELAKRVKEKLSVIQKIETGKMTPNTKLCRELEHELRVKLLLPRKEAIVPTTTPAEVTLGDIIRIKGKSKADLKL